MKRVVLALAVLVVLVGSGLILAPTTANVSPAAGLQSVVTTADAVSAPGGRHCIRKGVCIRCNGGC